MLNSTAEDKDIQAAECLRVGAVERKLLFALAVTLTGNQEDGHDLYTGALLDCHDAIQKRGFTGGNYKFYIMQAIKWANVERRRAVGLGHRCTIEEAGLAELSCHAQPQGDELAHLAAQVEQELADHYPPALVNAFKLRLAGQTFRQIEQVMGPGHEFSWVRRKLEKMKESLRATFGQSWDNINAE